MTLLLDAFFFSVAASHFMVDVLNGNSSVLFAYLSEPLALSNAALGLVGAAYLVLGALLQPLFGYLTDRIGPRWVVSGGLLWMAAFYTAGVLIPGRLALVFLVVASVGSGAFHPAGTFQATLQGRVRSAGRETTAASYFFLFGQAGLFVGPLLGGMLLESYGPPGLLVLTVLALPVALYAARRLRPTSPGLAAAPAVSGALRGVLRHGSRLLIALAALAALRSWAQQSMVVFIPKYLSDLGLTAGEYGRLAALFMGGSAVGNVVGGSLADRLGKRRIATVTLLLGTLPLLLIPMAGTSPWIFLLIPLAGALNGASHSIVVVFAQDLIPGGAGLASGLILGFMFSSGALGALLSGFLADVWGIPVVFPVAAAVTLAAAAFTRSLGEREPVEARQPASD